MRRKRNAEDIYAHHKSLTISIGSQPGTDSCGVWWCAYHHSDEYDAYCSSYPNPDGKSNAYSNANHGNQQQREQRLDHELLVQPQ